MAHVLRVISCRPSPSWSPAALDPHGFHDGPTLRLQGDLGGLPTIELWIRFMKPSDRVTPAQDGCGDLVEKEAPKYRATLDSVLWIKQRSQLRKVGLCAGN